MTSPSTTMSFGGAPGVATTGVPAAGVSRTAWPGTRMSITVLPISTRSPVLSDGVVETVAVHDGPVGRPEVLHGEAVAGGREAGVAAGDVGVLVEHDVCDARIAADHELLADGPLCARRRTGDECQDRSVGICFSRVGCWGMGEACSHRGRIDHQPANLHDRGELDPVAGLELARPRGRCPFTKVPLVEPRSSTATPPSTGANDACLEEISVSAMTTSAPGSRPTRTVPPMGNSRPASCPSTITRVRFDTGDPSRAPAPSEGPGQPRLAGRSARIGCSKPRTRALSMPPIPPGPGPSEFSTWRFQTRPASFLEGARRRFGDVWMLRLVGTRTS